MAKILIADDQPNVRLVIRFALEKEGFDVLEACNGEEALFIFNRDQIDLLILDVMMPEMDGLSLCKKIRAHSQIPILFLSSRDEEIDRILGLEMGGDDYLTKPFSPRELILRIKTILRRTSMIPQNPLTPDKYVTEPSRHTDKNCLILDFDQYAIRYQGQLLPLTATEFEIMKALLSHINKIFSRDDLLDKVYGNDIVVTDRTIDTHIRRLRKKFVHLGIDPIETIHGIGYKIQKEFGP